MLQVYLNQLYKNQPMVFKTKWYTEGGSGMWSHAPSTSTLAMVNYSAIPHSSFPQYYL